MAVLASIVTALTPVNRAISSPGAVVWTIIVSELVDIGTDFGMDFGISFRCLQVLMQCLWLTLADLVVIVGRDGGGHAFGELRQA